MSTSGLVGNRDSQKQPTVLRKRAALTKRLPWSSTRAEPPYLCALVMVWFQSRSRQAAYPPITSVARWMPRSCNDTAARLEA